MTAVSSPATPDPSVLMEIIKAQTEVAQLGLDLGGVMEFVADRVQHLTGAAGAIVELAEGDEMVYRAAVGIAAPQLGLRLDRVGSLSGMCVEQGRVLYCEDSETDNRVDRVASRKSKPVGILNLDMDGLKPINDVHGHRAGDAAIRELASRIGRSVRQSDTAARLSGDEFGIILPDIEDRRCADRFAERIAEEIRSPFNFEDRMLPLDASIGTAVFPDDGEELDTLMERADQSMYAVKRSRKSR